MRRVQDGWLTADMAARMLNVSHGYLCAMAQRGEIACEQEATGRRVRWFRVEDIEEAIGQREAAAWRRLDRKALPKRVPLRMPRLALTPDMELISTREAAAILGVRHQRVSELVIQGRLDSYQQETGKRGSRHRLRRAQVELFAQRPEYGKSKRLWERTRNNTAAPVPYCEQFDMRPYQWAGESVLTERDYGEFYTARQVGHLLGVSRTAVRFLVRRGKLHVVERPRAKRKRESSGKAWWWFRKEEVHALQADPEYRRGHAAWAKRLRARMAAREVGDLMEELERCIRVNREVARQRHELPLM